MVLNKDTIYMVMQKFIHKLFSVVPFDDEVCFAGCAGLSQIKHVFSCGCLVIPCWIELAIRTQGIVTRVETEHIFLLAPASLYMLSLS